MQLNGVISVIEGEVFGVGVQQGRDVSCIPTHNLGGGGDCLTQCSAKGHSDTRRRWWPGQAEAALQCSTTQQRVNSVFQEDIKASDPSAASLL